MVFGESIEVLCRDIGTHTIDKTTKPLIREIVTQLYISNLPIGCILYFARTEEVVPT